MIQQIWFERTIFIISIAFLVFNGKFTIQTLIIGILLFVIFYIQSNNIFEEFNQHTPFPPQTGPQITIEPSLRPSHSQQPPQAINLLLSGHHQFQPPKNIVTSTVRRNISIRTDTLPTSQSYIENMNQFRTKISDSILKR